MIKTEITNSTQKCRKKRKVIKAEIKKGNNLVDKKRNKERKKEKDLLFEISSTMKIRFKEKQLENTLEKNLKELFDNSLNCSNNNVSQI